MTPSDARSRSAAALALAALLLAGGLAGCLERDEGTGRRADAPSAASATSEKGWQVGNWWSYKAVFEENVTVDIALVVFEAFPDRATLGSNLSAGFFGLPFNGNVTLPNLNPVVGGDEWRLYDFPLHQGKSWEYELFGYTLTATAREATVLAPRLGEHAGFALEAKSFGQTIVRYTYSPEVEWFTELVLIEPTDGHEVVRVSLTGFGESYGDDYYVNVPVHTFHARYPAMPDSERFVVEASYLKLYGTLSMHGRVGSFDFTLDDPNGRTAMEGHVAPTGAHLDRAEIHPAAGGWTIEALGLGDGAIHFEMTALTPVRNGRVLPPGEGVVPERADAFPRVDPGALFGPIPRADGGAPRPELDHGVTLPPMTLPSPSGEPAKIQ